VPREVRITEHAVDRYQERVDPGASRQESLLALQQFAALGRRTVRPRHWMGTCRLGPGVQCIYWATRPGICLLVCNDAAVTAITRRLCQQTKSPVRLSAARPELTPQRRWRWDGDLNTEAA